VVPLVFVLVYWISKYKKSLSAQKALYHEAAAANPSAVVDFSNNNILGEFSPLL
jgi:hypothetical protein